MTTLNRFIFIAVGIFLTFVAPLSAHNSDAYIAQIYNDTNQPGTQTVGLVPLRRHGENTLTFPESRNMIAEDDITTRVTPHNGWVILGLTNNQTTNIHGKAAAEIVQMKDIRTARGYEWIKLHFGDQDMLPYDQLCKKLHAELQARGADFQFEPVVRFNNDSHTDWQVTAIGYESSASAEKANRKPLILKKELGNLAAREDGTIYAEDLKEFGNQVTLRTLYGKGAGDGGSSYILRRDQDGNWETFQEAVTLTDADSSWVHGDPTNMIVIDNRGSDQAVLFVNKEQLAVIPLGEQHPLMVAEFATKSKDGATVRIVYTSLHRNAQGVLVPRIDGEAFRNYRDGLRGSLPWRIDGWQRPGVLVASGS